MDVYALDNPLMDPLMDRKSRTQLGGLLPRAQTSEFGMNVMGSNPRSATIFLTESCAKNYRDLT